MKKTTLLTAAAAVWLILAASCGQSASKQPMTDEQYAVLKKEIFYSLPLSAMPRELQTKEQRDKMAYGVEAEDEDALSRIYVSTDPESINCLKYYYNDHGEHEDWDMAIYVTDDRQNVVVLIQYSGGVDEANGLIFDLTFNYNVKTKNITEIERPVDPFTPEELFQTYIIHDPYIKKQALEYLSGEDIDYNFDKNGFSVRGNLIMFWYDGDEEVFDYFNENDDIYDYDRIPAYRQWNGTRFVRKDDPNTPEQAQADEQPSEQIIKVSNATEFLAALGSRRTIELSPGKYNLSELDPFSEDVAADKLPKLPRGVSWEEQFDGGELVLNNIKNLTIRGTAAPGSAEIIVNPRYVFVLKFENCADIAIEGLSVGHSEGGYCQGGVFQFNNSSQITISNTGMYGCGTEGLLLEDVSGMKVTDSRIYKCTYDIMTVHRGRNITFEQCVFTDNQQFSLINVTETRNMSFTKCEFTNNRGGAMFSVDETTISVTNSTFSNNAVEDGVTNTHNVKFTDCTVNSD